VHAKSHAIFCFVKPTHGNARELRNIFWIHPGPDPGSGIQGARTGRHFRLATWPSSESNIFDKRLEEWQRWGANYYRGRYTDLPEHSGRVDPRSIETNLKQGQQTPAAPPPLISLIQPVVNSITSSPTCDYHPILYYIPITNKPSLYLPDTTTPHTPSTGLIIALPTAFLISYYNLYSPSILHSAQVTRGYAPAGCFNLCQHTHITPVTRLTS